MLTVTADTVKKELSTIRSVCDLEQQQKKSKMISYISRKKEIYSLDFSYLMENGFRTV